MQPSHAHTAVLPANDHGPRILRLPQRLRSRSSDEGTTNARWTFSVVLAVDIVGYCRLIAQDPLGTALRVRRLRRDILEPIALSFGGRLVDHAGDAALLSFPDADQALSAAIAIQRRVREVEAAPAARAPLRLRIGLDAGEVLVLDGAPYGQAVNVACRLQAIGVPGDILLTDAIRTRMSAKSAGMLECRGARSLRHIAEPVRVHRVAESGSRGLPGSG